MRPRFRLAIWCLPLITRAGRNLTFGRFPFTLDAQKGLSITAQILRAIIRPELADRHMALVSYWEILNFLQVPGIPAGR